MTGRRARAHAARALWAVLALCFALLSFGQVPVPPLTGRVVDQTNTLTADQKAALERTLAAFEARKGSQIAVLMVPSSAPEDIEQFSIRVAEQWKIGRKKVDDGAILVIAKDDRAARIEVGYGLEGALNDLTSKRILNEFILPGFRNQDFYGGITDGIERIIGVIDGEPLPEPAPVVGDAGELGQWAPVLFIVALAVGGLLRAALGRLPGSVATGGLVSLIAWFLLGTLSMALLAGMAAAFMTLLGIGTGRHGLAGYHVGGGAGGLGGGFRSGGFRGGGGGFGGGGASGRW